MARPKLSIDPTKNGSTGIELSELDMQFVLDTYFKLCHTLGRAVELIEVVVVKCSGEDIHFKIVMSHHFYGGPMKFEAEGYYSAHRWNSRAAFVEQLRKNVLERIKGMADTHSFAVRCLQDVLPTVAHP